MSSSNNLSASFRFGLRRLSYFLRVVKVVGLVAVGAAFLFCCARMAVPSGSPAQALAVGPPLRGLDASLSLLRDSNDEPSAADGFDRWPSDDPMALHYEEAQRLRALMGDAGSLALPIGGGAWQIGQGNRSISQHSIGRRACVEQLHDLVLQTPEQLARCGEANMVPVWEKGRSREAAQFCIDLFEFPNKACELPFVFVAPFQAKRICEAQGKRLCAQEEWNLACRGDPAGGPDRLYAYGNELDLTVCNTNKSRLGQSPPCDISTNEKLWATCGTNTEPSGALPGCRSRFGVFDQHGNVAEIMTRLEPAGGGVNAQLKSQLKGSAFFYVEVAEKPTDPGGYWTKYPDQCNFDPRWHVENLETAAHMNYHLGFRCCKSVDAL
jgi:sulfatase-modifying factor enzyme 1